MFSDNMNRKIITLMLCIGLITIGASSAMGMRLNSNRNLARPLVKIAMLTSGEDEYGVITGGFLPEDYYEIEISGGNSWQIKKLERALESDVSGFFKMFRLKNIDLKITYKTNIIDHEDATEGYATCLYEKDKMEIIEGSEIMSEQHTVIIKGFNGWFVKLGIGELDSEENELNDFMFIGGYESLDILLTD